MKNPLASFSNLQQRIISGLVLATIVIIFTYMGGFAFRLLAVAIGAGIYSEWRAITGSGKTFAVRVAEFGLVAIFAIILAGMPEWVIFAAIITTVLYGFALATVGYANFMLPLGLAYASVPVVSLALLRLDSTTGLSAILFLLAIVWSTDIFAYFVGKFFGGPRLAPQVSPNKTWSGAIGGAAAGMIAGVAVSGLTTPLTNPLLPFVCFCISVLSQMGDLFESWLKRKFGVKDSGNMIPGHGGVMDRVDGLVVAATALYLLTSIGRFL